MIFAAGLGTRLRPLTDKTPKALIEVGGKPLLYHAVNKLKAAGVDEIVINVHHLGEQIIEYVKSQKDFGIKVDISDESYFLRDTGGGILYSRDFLDGAPFLVHNVDILSDLDLRWFVSKAHPDALSNILVSTRDTKRYFLFNDEMRLVGWTNVETGEVRTPYFDIDISKCRKYAFGGIHYISNEIFKIFDADGWNGKFSITDFYIYESYSHPIYGIVPEELRLIDVGKKDSLTEAEKFLKDITN